MEDLWGIYSKHNSSLTAFTNLFIKYDEDLSVLILINEVEDQMGVLN